MTEKLDLMSLSFITKTDENQNNFTSLEYIWKWIIEVLFQTSSSRYEWIDFA